MAKPKPGGRRPRKRERKNVTTGVVHIKSSFNNTIVVDHRHRGQRHLVGVVRWRRLQGVAQEHPVRRPDGRREGRPRRDGARSAPRRSSGQGPGFGPRHRRSPHPADGHRGHLDQGRHPRTPQRLPPAQASRGPDHDHGSLHRPEGAHLASPRHQHLREREGPQGARASPVPARPARPHPSPQRRQRVPRPAAGEAEGEVHLRRARAAVPQAPTKRPSASPGPTGENLLRLLEQRLDNVVYRAGWASTRPQARQFVSHGLIQVNGKRVDIASYRVRKGEVVTLSPKAADDDRRSSTTSTRSTAASSAGSRPATVASRSPCATCPQRDHIDVPVRESLIVELYSK